MPSQRESELEAAAPRRVSLAGTPVDLCSHADVLRIVRTRLGAASLSEESRPLLVASANLDHVHHFGRGGRHQGIVGDPQSAAHWLVLLDGMPLVWRARALDRGSTWRRLAGSDLLQDLLLVAQADGHRVGFLGGTADTHARLAAALAGALPNLPVAGYWAPQRWQLDDDPASTRLAAEVRDAGVDLLVVGLGKPRQELWSLRYGPTTGAKVCLAFGAAADFIAGTVARAPEVLRSSGLEWLYRLALEPRRLSRRYLLQGPPALCRLLLHSRG